MGMLPMPEGSVEEQPAFAMRGTTQVFWGQGVPGGG